MSVLKFVQRSGSWLNSLYQTVQSSLHKHILQVCFTLQTYYDVHTYIHTYIHTHIHTYIYMHTYIHTAGNSTPHIDIDNSSFTINVTCRHDFYEINNTCTPRCDKWEQSPHDTTIAVLTVLNFAAWLGLLVGVIVIISSCIRYKNM